MRVRSPAPILDSALARAAALVHRLLAVGAWTLVACSPTVAAGLALGGDVTNVPLLGVAALPVGPAVAAALSALAAHRPDLADLHPAADFRRGYRLVFGRAVRLWAPFLALLTIVAINLTHLDVAGVPGWWAVPLALIGVTACLWVAVALTLVALSPGPVPADAAEPVPADAAEPVPAGAAEPASVIARRAARLLMARPGVTLAVAWLLVVAAGVTLAWSEAALLIAAPLLLFALLEIVRRGHNVR
ncbi:putative small integral membrane protein [Catenuloplanes nepalensis]|uniref:Small integral membrane protein n=1 Tax=Catenuloplanes nepalensis TaxID=587533 RepID=A0ABT9MV26_9ACTN|nr:hypothetical protein [Catenuloplanes nepalensis]MDP9794871.1 putative small integral membrane protein [Catenuloplanes nepalensis]